jgi:hypothetical protein
MIALILLVCVCSVGVLGLVAMALGVKQSLARHREGRAKLAARREVERLARESTKTAAVPKPIPQPVNDLTGVIAKLEESARFALPIAETPPPPRRSAKGSVAPFPAQVAAPPVQAPAQRAPMRMPPEPPLPPQRPVAPPLQRPPLAQAAPRIAPPTGVPIVWPRRPTPPTQPPPIPSRRR